MLHFSTNGLHQRSPLAALRLFYGERNVSKGAETAGALPFLAPSKANKSNSELCLSSFDLNWTSCAWSPAEWFDVSFLSDPPQTEKQRDRVVRLAVLTAEGSGMTEPEANNSHYPSASVSFREENTTTTSAQYTNSILTNREKLHGCFGEMTCRPWLWCKQTLNKQLRSEMFLERQKLLTQWVGVKKKK